MINAQLIAKTRPMAKEENMVVRGKYRVTVLTPCLFRIEKSEGGQFCDHATQRVWFRDLDKVSFTVVDEGVLTLCTQEVELHICEPFQRVL